MTFLPEATVLVAYSVACFVLFITPGPDMSLFLAKTISGGRKAGIAAMLGAQAGCCVHTMLAALGLSALLAASEGRPLASSLLQIAGQPHLAEEGLVDLALDVVFLKEQARPREVVDAAHGAA